MPSRLPSGGRRSAQAWPAESLTPKVMLERPPEIRSKLSGELDAGDVRLEPALDAGAVDPLDSLLRHGRQHMSEKPCSSTSAGCSPPPSGTASPPSAARRGSTRTRSRTSSAPTRRRSPNCAAWRPASSSEADFERHLRPSGSGSSNPDGLIDSMFAGMQPLEPEMVDAVAGDPRERAEDRAGLQLLEHGALRPRPARRALRRDRDLRRGRAAQAPARDLPAGRRAPRGRARPTASSSTTCRRTARAPRRSG